MTTQARVMLLVSCAITLLGIPRVQATDTHYVSPDGGNIPPYTNWATAALRIQDAVSVASSGSVVLVAAGVYDEGVKATPGYGLLNRVVLTNGISLRSVDGPELTIIEGSGSSPLRPATRGVFMTAGSELVGFTVRGGRTLLCGVFPYEQNGGGVYLSHGGSVSNCVIEFNEAQEGGGVYIVGDGLVSFCTIRSNQAIHGGGGVRFSDAASAVVEQCRILDNTSSEFGGGVHIYHMGRVRSSLIAGNQAGEAAGGVYVDWGTWESGAHIENCTIVNNSAPSHGWLHYIITGGSVRNSIIWGNANGNWSGGTYQHTLTTPLPSGEGNISSAPVFADSDYRLSPDSPGVDAGSNAYVTTPVDLDNQPRIVGASVDMGAYELPEIPGAVVSVPLVPAGISTVLTGVMSTYETGGSESSDESVVEYRFDWGDGSYSSWTVSGVSEKAWSEPGEYQVRAQARSSLQPWSMSAWSPGLDVTVVDPVVEVGTYYVSPEGGNIPPYTNWATAALTIQDAVSVASSGSVVLVAAGVYDEGGAPTPGHGLLNRVLLTDGVSVRSVDGPEVTIIEGASGDSPVRGVFMTAGSSLSGFTIRGASTLYGTGVFPYEQNGGGVYLSYGGSVSNCVIEFNEAQEGGGVYIVGDGLVSFSTIRSNHAHHSGGGVRFSDAALAVVEQCRIVENTTSGHGGGVHIYHMGRVRSSLIAGNKASLTAGGVYVDWGTWGSGAHIENCTIVDNSAPSHGGLHYIITGGSVRNSIIWGNANGNWSGGTYRHTLTTPLPSGEGNISSAPVFADEDYRLSPDSPGVDAGLNAYVTTPVDLDNQPRIVGASVDMGAYELPEDESVVLSLQEVTLHGYDRGGYMMMATDDGQSTFGSESKGLVLRWDGKIGYLYTIEVSSDLDEWFPIPEFTNVAGSGTQMLFPITTEHDRVVFVRVRSMRNH